jgi:hypothetical protein
MRTSLVAVLLSGCLLLAGRPARAHHSFAAEFDIDKPLTLTGVLTRMDWVNPHGRMYVDVRGADGIIAHWSVQTGGPTQLLRRGIEKDTFTAGIQVTIKGFRARDDGMTLHGETVTLKDGRNLFVGEIPISSTRRRSYGSSDEMYAARAIVSSSVSFCTAGFISAAFAPLRAPCWKSYSARPM